jgi:MoaA/NifB/PqqE/SkfB family radical SAM enzyme
MSPLPARLRLAAEWAHLRPAPGPPTQVHVSVTDRCNLPCLHCAIHRKRTTDLPTRTWLRFFDDVSAWLGPDVGVNFAGGEPLLRKDLEELIAHAVGKGFTTTFNTNGWLLTEERTASIAASGVSIVYVSLDGTDEALVDRTRNRAGAYRRALEGIDRLRGIEGGPQVIVACILHGQNAGQVPQLIELVRERGLQLVIQPLYQTFDEPYDPRWHERSELWPRDLGPIDAAIDALIAERRVWGPVCNPIAQLEGIRRYFHAPDVHNGLPCRAGHSDIAVDAQGALRLCFMLDPIGNITDTRSTERAWTHPRALRRRWQVAHCTRPCNLLNCNFEGVGEQ